MEIFVSNAYYIGAHRIKDELEDLSFKYLKPSAYLKMKENRETIIREYNSIITEMLLEIDYILTSNNVDNTMKVRAKNLYGIYRKLNKGVSLESMHDLLALKIVVDNKLNCYKSLGLIHSIYHPLNEKFKDYISLPKTNLYSSLHTSLFVNNEKIIQAQIRTNNMDKIASFDFPAYWYLQNNNSRIDMQNKLNEKCQVYKSLSEISTVSKDDGEFVRQVKDELFKENVYPYDMNGNRVELKKGATIIDYVCLLYGDDIIHMRKAIVNDKPVNFSYKIQNSDVIKIVFDKDIDLYDDKWNESAILTLSKTKLNNLKRH